MAILPINDTLPAHNVIVLFIFGLGALVGL